MRVYSRFLFVSLAASLAVWTTAQEPAAKPDKVISITAERFAFSPSKIRVRKGAIVELVITTTPTTAFVFLARTSMWRFHSEGRVKSG